MGLPDAVFWNLTLTLFLALHEQLQARERRADRRAGTIAAALINVNLREGAEPLDWQDFFPAPGHVGGTMTETQMAERLSLWAANGAGRG